MTATIAVIIVSTIVSCTQDETPTTNIIKEKTIVFYIVADNNLYAEADSLLSDLSKSVLSDDNTNILVYVDDFGTPRLYKLHDGYHKLYDYIEMNSLSPKKLKNILEYISVNFPARENGLILWSHGSGWIHTDSSVYTRSFGLDSGSIINTNNLFEILPCYYDYIIFDACYMAAIEVVTDARKKCGYIVGSPEIVPSMGIMDRNALNILLHNVPLQERLVELCNNYVERYKNYTEDISISICKTEETANLLEFLANTNYFEISKIDVSKIISYDFRFYKIFFDIRDVFEKLCIPTQYLDNIIVFNANGMNNSVRGCGLSVFIPTKQNEIYLDSYKMLNWEKETLWSEKCISSTKSIN